MSNLKNAGRILVLFDLELYGTSGKIIYNFLKKMSPASWVDIKSYTSHKSLKDILLKHHKLGYRCFLSPTIDESTMINVIMPFFKFRPDSIYFDTYSTFDFDKSLFSDNIIFLAMNDQSTCEYIVNKILYNYDSLTQPNTDSDLYTPISGIRKYNSKNELLPIFENIIYIYNEKDNNEIDMYASGYGNKLYNASLNHPDISFQSVMITDTNFVLPDNIKNLLSSNPVSGRYFESSKKTIFIVNSSSPTKMLSLFNEEYMYDNYFIFGDPFLQQHYDTIFQFKYAIITVGAYSYDGYKLSTYLSPSYGKYFSPFLYSLFDIIGKFHDFWSFYIFYKYKMKKILDDLKKMNTLFIIIIGTNEKYLHIT